jgi:hypothetical protein
MQMIRTIVKTTSWISVNYRITSQIKEAWIVVHRILFIFFFFIVSFHVPFYLYCELGNELKQILENRTSGESGSYR